MTTVLVSGANGYVGAQVTKHLIEKGYHVVGTVRSAAKGDTLKAQLGANFSYEIVTSLSNEDAFDETLKKHPEISVFLHTASPVALASTDPENELLKPAKAGTLSALTAAHKYGKNIKKFVLTSSVVTMAQFFSDKPSKNVDETLWNPVTYEEAITVPGQGYPGSKKFAEKAAWDFVEKEKPGFTLTTVNPSIVMGPPAFTDEGLNSFVSTGAWIRDTLLAKDEKDLLTFGGPAVDVGDVARIHIAAFENEKLAGKRLLATNQYWDAQLVLDIARKHYPQLCADLPTGTPGSTAEAAKKSVQLNNEATTRLSGIEWVPIETSVRETIDVFVKLAEAK